VLSFVDRWSDDGWSKGWLVLSHGRARAILCRVLITPGPLRGIAVG
jgi:hypothetical protein